LKLDLSTVGISCVACGTRTTLEKAIQDSWHQCLRCQFFIDPHCLQIVQNTMGGVCPSFSQGVTRHTLQPVDIPSEQILIFVIVLVQRLQGKWKTWEKVGRSG